MSDCTELIASVSATDDEGLGRGFYPIDWLSDGTPFRWTGPETSFEIQVDVQRDVPAIAQLVVFGSISPHNLDNMFCTRDGEIILVPSRSQDGVSIIDVALPARLRSGATRLVFHAQETCRPPQYPLELRDLGLGFIRLDVIRERPHEKGQSEDPPGATEARNEADPKEAVAETPSDDDDSPRRGRPWKLPDQPSPLQE